MLDRMLLIDTARNHGARSTKEYVASRLDVSPEVASQLVHTVQTMHRNPKVRNALEDGEITFSRAVELFKQPIGTADPETSRRWDIVGLRRLAHRERRLSHHQERDAYTHRYVAIQPNLDESQWDLHGRLAGTDGRVVEKALHDRGDVLGELPDGETLSRGQRNADALIAISQDSLDGDPDGEAGSGSQVSVFVDLDRANGNGAEAGGEVECGPRVGPMVLEELLYVGSVQVIGLQKGRPVMTSDSTRAIPPAIRRHVAWRDGACTADGCTSRYRLEPHHILEWSHGGDHHPDNLTTLCWFHHHVVVHGHGFHIDPQSPPGRIRFTRNTPKRAPP